MTSDIKVGSEVIYNGYDTRWTGEHTQVLDIATFNGVEIALVRLGGRSWRVEVEDLKSVEVDEKDKRIAELERDLAAIEAKLGEAQSVIEEAVFALDNLDSPVRYATSGVRELLFAYDTIEIGGTS